MNKVEVVRDAQGFWCHPDIPEFDEGQNVEYFEWLMSLGLVTTHAMLEWDDETNPVYVSYFEDGEGNISAWEPAQPAGDGWFTISIHDTEDGPVWVWARHEKIETKEPHCIHCNDSGEASYGEGRCNYCAKK